jgi:hypothetical protein
LCSKNPPTEPCRQAAEVEAWLRSPQLDVIGAANTPGGMQGAKLLTMAVPAPEGRIVFRAKWRAYSTASMVNDPRKELAAYAFQKLILDPHQYVVPPTAGRCFDLQHYRSSVDKEAQGSFGVSCVYGILSYWLERVTEVEKAGDEGILADNELLDSRLFKENQVYRHSVASVNLMATLVNHGDAHGKQFLLTKQARVFSVDNSIAFESVKNPMLLFRDDWSKIQVPAVPKSVIERLRRVNDDQLAKLAVIEQYTKREGQLVPIPLTGVAGSADSGLRQIGNEIQLGLTRAELDGLRERIGELLEDVEDGDVKTF